MLQARIKKYQLQFKRPAGTSRGVYKTRDSWILQLWDDVNPELVAYGECAPLPDLSSEYDEHYEAKLSEVAERIDDFFYWIDEGLVDYPSIRFGLEAALIDFQNGCRQQLYESPFASGEEGILINGLIWMGDADYIREQINSKLAQGFSCIKLKIGANNIEEELAILTEMRQEFPKEKLEIRVDANGAFDADEVMPILEHLSALGIHSIEQPIAQGQYGKMRFLCRKSPIDIALDEEMIGVNTLEDKKKLLKNTKPQYLILKPSLHGGISGCEEWIALAESKGIGWWVTSALESNIGLNAIAQWVSSMEITMPQGLGTGQLYVNNIPSPLQVRGEKLFHNAENRWDFSFLS